MPYFRDRSATVANVRAECERRIFKVLPATAQLNLNRYVVLNPTDTDTRAAYATAGAWIDAMRGTCSSLVDDPAYLNDASWPAPSQGTIDLGGSY